MVELLTRYAGKEEDNNNDNDNDNDNNIPSYVTP
jgi:hypothetical protein